MLKLLTMLVAFLLVALALLGLRQRRLELTSQSVVIYSQIRERNETLLDLQVAIAQTTNPWTLADALQRSGVNTGKQLAMVAGYFRRGLAQILPAGSRMI